MSSSPTLEALHAAPGNPGIASLGTCHPVAADDGDGLLTLARSLAAELVVIGPEAPLVEGVGDALRHAGIPVFGPSRAAARIEGSKLFAKDVMKAAKVPNALVFGEPRAPCVLKANGLAAGKGVVVCRTDAELVAGLETARAFGGPVLVEELLEGPEVSVLALCDGRDVLALAPARDFKRAFDGDEGPNTGGMGSFAPVPEVDEALLAELLETCVRPTLAELSARGTPFVGTLFAGLMLTEDGPRTPDSQLYMYIGRKDRSSDNALRRNGLDNGKLYVFASDDAVRSTDRPFADEEVLAKIERITQTVYPRLLPVMRSVMALDRARIDSRWGGVLEEISGG